jgi:hypothetical protein
MNQDGDKPYTKLRAFDKIYNFVQTFSFEVILGLKNGILSRSQFSVSRSKQYMNCLSLEMTSNEKRLNYKVVDLVESYKFRTKFISIRVHTKKLRFFENRLNLTVMDHCGCRCYNTNRRSPRRFNTAASAIAVAHVGLPLPPWTTVVVG